jgi:hypothetical protein
MSGTMARSGRLVHAEPLAPASTQAKAPRLRAQLGEAIRYPESHGDLWTATWAADGNLYVASDDTQGFDKTCSSNLAINRISGNMPPEIHGVTINPMKEFDGWGEVRKEDGADWKAWGLISIEGVLYLCVNRLGETNPETKVGPPCFVYETWDASIVKSHDNGMTWSPAPKLGHAMFPGHTFSTPFFVQFGKDGQNTEKDDAGRYAYAASNDGVWNNGNWMTMGRVRRDRIGRLDPSDWEFIHGFDAAGRPIWRPRHDNACYIFRSPDRTSVAGIHYIASLDLYVLPQWHYTHLENPERRWKATQFEFYHAPSPWGPWTLFHVQDFEPQGWYNPCIPSKFISDNGKRLWLFVAGDWTDSETTHGLYGLWMIPVTLELTN